MSTEFPNSLYVPTGISLDRDFIKYEGYCYKKVSSNVTLSNQTLRSDIFGDYEDCVDCNSCECPKTIDFIFGGFQYEGTNVTYRETTIPIKTCSTGWQEIALESGFLNGNDENINFEMELSRNWHWMWSTFYFNKKHFGYLNSLFKVSGKFFSAFIKSIFYTLILNKVKRKIYYQRLSGLFNSIIGKDSWYRPKL